MENCRNQYRHKWNFQVKMFKIHIIIGIHTQCTNIIIYVHLLSVHFICQSLTCRVNLQSIQLMHLVSNSIYVQSKGTNIRYVFNLYKIIIYICFKIIGSLISSQIYVKYKQTTYFGSFYKGLYRNIQLSPATLVHLFGFFFKEYIFRMNTTVRIGSQKLKLQDRSLELVFEPFVHVYQFMQ